MPGKAARVRVSEKQWVVLQELSRSRTVAKGIAQRALILVLGSQGLRNEQIALEVGLIRRQVGLWRRRWRDAWDSLCAWECTEPHRLREAILEVGVEWNVDGGAHRSQVGQYLVAPDVRVANAKRPCEAGAGCRQRGESQLRE